MNNVAKVRFFTFAALILLAPLSKYPSLATPLFNFSSFRVGFYQLLAVCFVLLCLPLLKSFNWQNNKLVLGGIGLILISLLAGSFWALDYKRWALLGVSIISLLALLMAAWVYVKTLDRGSIKKIAFWAVYASIIFAVLTIAQFIFNTFLKEDLGILCVNCTNAVFGFPRVNLFAAEPQFLANSLLPFVFINAYLLIKTNNKLPTIGLFLSALAIGLTFSRGAFFALGIGLAFFALGFYLAKQNLKQIAKVLLAILSGLLISFLLLFGSASITKRNTENIEYNTAKTMLEQLSLGQIQLPDRQINVLPGPAPNNDNFVSPGLIKASTNDRLNAAELALKAWSNKPKNILFGVGLGNLGPYVVANIDSSAPNNLTVYIYYVLILAELGFMGLLGVLILLIVPIYKITRLLITSKIPALYVLAAIIVSFVAQYLFFGSYINVVYVWLWLGITIGISEIKPKQLSKLFK